MNLEAVLRKAGVSREDADDIIESRNDLAKTMSGPAADKAAVRGYLDDLDGEAKEIAAQVLDAGGDIEEVRRQLDID